MKTFFIIFKGLSPEKIKPNFFQSEGWTLNRLVYFTCNTVSVIISVRIKWVRNDIVATPFIKVLNVIFISLVILYECNSGISTIISLYINDHI